MDLDRILHDAKSFAELVDSDVACFLQDRRFNSEHLNLEFKAHFPTRNDGKYDIKKICRYIVGFSNEEGGLIIYGVSDKIKDQSVAFPDYVEGLQTHPTLEDLSQWVTERVHPLVQSPAIRFFAVENRKIYIIKIPSGVNRPYSYYDPATKSLVFFKKTAGGIVELSPDDLREAYRTAIIEQSERILRAAEFQTRRPSPESEPARLLKHKALTLPKLENIADFGHVGIYCAPHRPLEISVEELEKFVSSDLRFRFSEVLRFYPTLEPFQGGLSIGYFPRAIRQDIKSTARLTLYRDGLITYDSQADMDMGMHVKGGGIMNPYWLAYEIQRHLQLTKAIMGPLRVDRINATLELNNVEQLSLIVGHSLAPHAFTRYAYGGSHEPIRRDIPLGEISDFDGSERNVAMPVVRDMLDEVSRIFGLSRTPDGVWDANGKLVYVRGLENQR